MVGGGEGAIRRKLLLASRTTFGRRVRKLLVSNVRPQHKEVENDDGKNHEFQRLLLVVSSLSQRKEPAQGS
jgi:hypothetical protein